MSEAPSVEQPWWINAHERPRQISEIENELVNAGLCEWAARRKPHPMNYALVAWYALHKDAPVLVRRTPSEVDAYTAGLKRGIEMALQFGEKAREIVTVVKATNAVIRSGESRRRPRSSDADEAIRENHLLMVKRTEQRNRLAQILREMGCGEVVDEVIGDDTDGD